MFDFFVSLIKIALCSFGGGFTIVAMIQKEFVDTGLISMNDFAVATGLVQIIPGPSAPGVAAYIAYKLYGITGVLVSCIALFLPSLILSIIFLRLRDRLKETKILDSIYLFLKPIIIALIASVFIFFLKISVFDNHTFISLSDFINYFNIKAAVIFGISLIALLKFKTNLIYIIAVSGLLGMVMF